MNIGIVVFGSDGEVQPHIELAIALARKSHKVQMLIISIRNRDYSSLNSIENITVTQVPFPAEKMESKYSRNEFWKLNEYEQGEYFHFQFMLVRRLIRRFTGKMVKSIDLLIGNRQVYPARYCAEAAGILYIGLCYEPAFIKSKYYPPISNQEGSYEDNLATWEMARYYANKYLLPEINEYRKLYKLPVIDDYYSGVLFSDKLNIVSFSKALLGEDMDWESQYHICGYFNAKERNIQWDIPESLMAFIDRGISPVFVSLGSLTEYESDISVIQKILVEGIKKANCRAILLSKDPITLPHEKDVYFLNGFVDYAKLLPFCRMAIHHGGVGTLHSVATAGIPAIILAYGFDQFSNAKLLKKVGICKYVLSRHDVNADQLADAVLGSFEDEMMQKKALEIGSLIRQEDGLKEAVDMIEEKYEELAMPVSASENSM